MNKNLSKNLFTIDLPKNTSDIFIEVRIKSGDFFHITKKAQLPHLFEHCVATLLHMNDIKFDAIINEEFVTFFAVFSRKKLYEAKIFFDTIFLSDFPAEIIENEKLIIAKEISYLRIIDRIMKFCTDKDDRVKKINAKEIVEFRQKYVSVENTNIFIGGYKLKPEIINEIKNYLNDIEINNNTKMPIIPICIKNLNLFFEKKNIISIPTENDMVDIVLIWKCFDYRDDIKKLVSQNIINSMFVSGKDSLLFKKLRLENGFVYSVDGGTAIWGDFGYIYFHTSTKTKEVENVLGSINLTISDILKNGVEKKILNKIVKTNKKNNKNEWSNNSRFGWIVTDLLFFGKIYSAKEVNKVSDGISENDINRFFEEIFRADPTVFLIGDFNHN